MQLTYPTVFKQLIFVAVAADRVVRVLRDLHDVYYASHRAPQLLLGIPRKCPREERRGSIHSFVNLVCRSDVHTPQNLVSLGLQVHCDKLPTPGNVVDIPSCGSKAAAERNAIEALDICHRLSEEGASGLRILSELQRRHLATTVPVLEKAVYMQSMD